MVRRHATGIPQYHQYCEVLMVWICHIHDLDHQIDDQEHDTKRLVTRSRSSGESIMYHMYLCTGTGTSNSTEHGRRTDARTNNHQLVVVE